MVRKIFKKVHDSTHSSGSKNQKGAYDPDDFFAMDLDDMDNEGLNNQKNESENNLQGTMFPNENSVFNSDLKEIPINAVPMNFEDTPQSSLQESERTPSRELQTQDYLNFSNFESASFKAHASQDSFDSSSEANSVSEGSVSQPPLLPGLRPKETKYEDPNENEFSRFYDNLYYSEVHGKPVVGAFILSNKDSKTEFLFKYPEELNVDNLDENESNLGAKFTTYSYTTRRDTTEELQSCLHLVPGLAFGAQKRTGLVDFVHFILPTYSGNVLFGTSYVLQFTEEPEPTEEELKEKERQEQENNQNNDNQTNGFVNTTYDTETQDRGSQTQQVQTPGEQPVIVNSTGEQPEHDNKQYYLDKDDKSEEKSEDNKEEDELGEPQDEVDKEDNNDNKEEEKQEMPKEQKKKLKILDEPDNLKRYYVAICLVFKVPFFGLIGSRLEYVAQSYFDSKNFEDHSLLLSFVEHINRNDKVEDWSYESLFFNLEYHFKPFSLCLSYRALLFLLKSLLTEQRIAIYSECAARTSTCILSVLTMIPCANAFNFNSKAFGSLWFNWKKYGFPLDIFRRENPVYPYFTESMLPLLDHTSGYLVGITDLGMIPKFRNQPALIFDLEDEVIKLKTRDLLGYYSPSFYEISFFNDFEIFDELEIDDEPLRMVLDTSENIFHVVGDYLSRAPSTIINLGGKASRIYHFGRSLGGRRHKESYLRLFDVYFPGALPKFLRFSKKVGKPKAKEETENKDNKDNEQNKEQEKVDKKLEKELKHKKQKEEKEQEKLRKQQEKELKKEREREEKKRLKMEKDKKQTQDYQQEYKTEYRHDKDNQPEREDHDDDSKDNKLGDVVHNRPVFLESSGEQPVTVNSTGEQPEHDNKQYYLDKDDKSEEKSEDNREEDGFHDLNLDDEGYQQRDHYKYDRYYDEEKDRDDREEYLDKVDNKEARDLLKSVFDKYRDKQQQEYQDKDIEEQDRDTEKVGSKDLHNEQDEKEVEVKSEDNKEEDVDKHDILEDHEEEENYEEEEYRYENEEEEEERDADERQHQQYLNNEERDREYIDEEEEEGIDRGIHIREIRRNKNDDKGLEPLDDLRAQWDKLMNPDPDGEYEEESDDLESEIPAFTFKVMFEKMRKKSYYYRYLGYINSIPSEFRKDHTKEIEYSIFTRIQPLRDFLLKFMKSVAYVGGKGRRSYHLVMDFSFDLDSMVDFNNPVDGVYVMREGKCLRGSMQELPESETEEYEKLDDCQKKNYLMDGDKEITMKVPSILATYVLEIQNNHSIDFVEFWIQTHNFKEFYKNHNLEVFNEPVFYLTRNLAKYTYPNGDFYVGELVDMLRDGRGSYVSKDGSRYDGSWKRDKRFGKGTLITNNMKYTGEWVNDKKHGFGRLETPNCSYVGDFRHNRYHGNGTMVHKDGVKLKGEFKYGRFEGKGMMTLPDGSVRMGTFKNGVITGICSVIDKNGKVYVGQLYGDLFHGKGVLKYNKHTCFEGYWVKGRRSKQGTISTVISGSVLKVEAVWEDDNMLMNDVLVTFPNGYKYNGSLKYFSRYLDLEQIENDREYKHLEPKLDESDLKNFVEEFNKLNNKLLPHGNGICKDTQGGVYNGTFYYGSKHGKTSQVFPNGLIYTGPYYLGRLHGKGRLQVRTDGSIPVEFKKGKLETPMYRQDLEDLQAALSQGYTIFEEEFSKYKLDSLVYIMKSSETLENSITSNFENPLLQL